MNLPQFPRFLRSALTIVVSLAAIVPVTHAAPWLPAIFGDHMVLQSDRPVKFWGKAAAGEQVKIRLIADDGQTLAEASTTTGSDQKWATTLPAVPAGRTITVRVSGNQSGEREFANVLTGEVWLLSGQSNMRWTVAKSRNAAEEIAAADYPEIRLFVVELGPVGAPVDNLKGKWEICSPETIGNFSGAGYYFGRDLHAALGVPVGLILSAVGGTPIEAWTSMDALESTPASEDAKANYEAYFAQPPDKRQKARGTWIYGGKSEKGPAFLFNGMIHPLIPFSIRGVAWCQGEANDRDKSWGGGPSLYREVFPVMISDWRKKWDEGDLPFLYVELANYMAPQESPIDAEAEINWAGIREAQSAALELPNVYAVSAIDIGEADEIHYADKQTVGQRLCLAALRHVYGKSDAAAGPALSPRYLSHEIRDGKVHIELVHAEGGLLVDDNRSPNAFAIRGEDGDWQWAAAKIDGEQIILWNDAIANPVAVRHAWASNPDVNVYNRSRLPLMPFRTDSPVDADFSSGNH